MLQKCRKHVEILNIHTQIATADSEQGKDGFLPS